jgi:hypothetical protein
MLADNGVSSLTRPVFRAPLGVASPKSDIDKEDGADQECPTDHDRESTQEAPGAL